MRTLLLGLNFDPELTGIGRYTGETARHLRRLGHNVRAISAPPYYPDWKIGAGYSGWRYQRQALDGLTVYRCPVWVPRRPTGLKRLIHLLSFGISAVPVAIVHALWRPRVVLCIVPTMFSAPAALLAAKLGGAKCWLHIQDFELDAALGLGMLPGGALISRMAQAFERFVLTHFDRVSSISDNMLALAVQKGVDPARAVLLSNWVDTSRIYPLKGPIPLRAQLGIPDDAQIVLYHGNLGRKQGLDTLRDAASELCDLPGILFLLCGEGAARTELQQRARTLSNVRFAPLQPEERLNELVNLADVHVLPQLAGAADLVMPSKLTTMLASGKPVIACAAPGTQLWKVVSQVGATVMPESASDLARAIVQLLENPQERARLGRLGRAYACTHLEKEVILAAFARQLESLASQSQPAGEIVYD